MNHLQAKCPSSTSSDKRSSHQRDFRGTKEKNVATSTQYSVASELTRWAHYLRVCSKCSGSSQTVFNCNKMFRQPQSVELTATASQQAAQGAGRGLTTIFYDNKSSCSCSCLAYLRNRVRHVSLRPGRPNVNAPFRAQPGNLCWCIWLLTRTDFLTGKMVFV